MKVLTQAELRQVSGGELTPDEGATLILALGAAGGPATFAFGAPIALALYYLY
jgi:bacteriocin-like protein